MGGFTIEGPGGYTAPPLFVCAGGFDGFFTAAFLAFIETFPDLSLGSLYLFFMSLVTFLIPFAAESPPSAFFLSSPNTAPIPPAPPPPFFLAGAGFLAGAAAFAAACAGAAGAAPGL